MRIFLSPLSLVSFLPKELLQQGGGFGGAKAGFDLHLMVELRVIEDRKDRSGGTRLGIKGGEDEAGDAGVEECSGAHRAGFEGREYFASGEAIILKVEGGGAQCENFCVRGGIVKGDRAIGRFRDDGLIEDNNGSDGDLSGSSGGASQGQRVLHPLLVQSAMSCFDWRSISHEVRCQA